jgi:NAD(P)H dehydrogenase (quinone)
MGKTKALVVLGHSVTGSFNEAVAKSVASGLEKEGYEVVFRDLANSPINPLLTQVDLAKWGQGSAPDEILKEQALVKEAELLAFVYPVWWFDRPAVLKGWFDRVFSPGFAYLPTDTGVNGLLAGKRAVIVQTTGGPEALYDRYESLPAVTRAMTEGTLGFCGIQDVRVRTLFAVTAVDDQARASYLEQTENWVAEQVADKVEA